MGAAIAFILRRQFGDVPFPSFTPVETTVGTPETQKEIKRFSAEAREALEEQGYVVYSLGQSIRTLNVRAGRKFWSRRCQDYSSFEVLTSIKSEVAINPKALFLPGSNDKTLRQQEEMVDRFSEGLGKKIPGVKSIIGQAPDYLELAFAHLDKTGDFLFGEKYHCDFARTKTPTNGSRVASVGDHGLGDGFYVSDWPADLGSGDLYVAPLVVPS